MKKTIYTLFILAIGLISSAQKAEDLYDHLSYQDAIEKYQVVLEDEPQNGDALYNLANAYRLNSKTVEAEKYFADAVKFSGEQKSKLYYAQMLMSNGKAQDAIKWFKEYKPHTSGKETERIEQFIVLCNKLENNAFYESNMELRIAPFNSDKMDFSPTYYKEKIVFVSNRETGLKTEKDKWTNENYTDLYIVDLAKAFEVKKFDKRVNGQLHEGPATYFSSSDKVIFTRSNLVKNKTRNDKSEDVRLQLMESELLEGKWTKPSPLALNSNAYSYCHPTLSKDESFMIFASDQPGGFGGMDLYQVKREGNSWGTPVNMGSKINTSGNEVFPFVDAVGNLYFSSDFHVGFGGLDIFLSKLIKDDVSGFKFNTAKNYEYTLPVNVGLPLNSVKDDFGALTKDNFDSGYISSNRSGNDEIYSFKRLGRVVEGSVVDCVTGYPIPDAKVEVKEFGKIFLTTWSDNEGNFRFEVDDANLELFAKATKEGYLIPKGCVNSADVEFGKVLELGITSERNVKTHKLCGTVINDDCNYLLAGAKITTINLCNGEKTVLIADENGQFSFPLTDNCKYKLVIEKDFFETEIRSFSTEELSEDCLELDVKMNSLVDLRDPSLGLNGLGNPNNPNNLNNPNGSGIGAGNPNTPISDRILLQEGASIDLYNVYFDLDKFTIRTDAIEELQWVLKIMNKFPEMTVEIGAHTDARATDLYNITLSENRAKAVREYLINKGIAANRITAKGYGETQLKNNCFNGVDCTEIQHQRNRRVEFKITKFSGKQIVSKEWKAYK